jgi:hypothetical protein
MKDLETQISFIVNSVERLLKQIDQDPLSPTFGCSHLAYWRDKTADVADMRRQEVMLAFALLYSRDYPESPWRENSKLEFSIEALLRFWCANQYPDGSFDEWYKGERAFAAAAFTTHAVARTLKIMSGKLPADLLVLSKKKLARTAKWLTGRDDLFKTNHQAVGVAALAWAAKILQDDSLKSNAHKKLQSIIQAQTKEGWFPEVGHMDVGYTFLTVEFVAITMDLWADWKEVEPFRRAFDFACEWIHPDLTIGEEYGVCHNPYLSRIAIVLMSAYSGRAAWLRHRLEGESVGVKGFISLLSDDLRLLRWSYLPLLAWDYASQTKGISPQNPEPIPLANTNMELKRFVESGIARFSCGEATGLTAAVSGSLVRLFGIDPGMNLSDFGYAIHTERVYATNLTYNRNLSMEETEEGFEMVCPISRVKKFMPPYWARVALRLACSSSFGSKMTRKMIDVVRKKKGTALNQASFNLSSSNSAWYLRRQVSVLQDHIVVRDNLTFKTPILRDELYFLESKNDEPMAVSSVALCHPNIPEKLNQLEIIKRYRPSNQWTLEECLAQ